MLYTNQPLTIHRRPELLAEYYELKDPCVVQTADGEYMMFASIGNSQHQKWQVGRFITRDLKTEWQELEPVIFENIAGPQLCAPAVTYEIKDGQPLWTMYIQTACFEENGVIALATSTNGHTFTGQPQPLLTKDDLNADALPVVGVYDVGISEVKNNDEDLICLTVSGYRKVGCGDLYVSYRKKNEATWSRGQRLLAQEDVPFHNPPSYEDFEWGLEGAKIIQLAPDCYLLIGVCFMPKPKTYLGTRQRVFMAAASSLNGPFVPLGMPFSPNFNPEKTGENGHPDAFIEGDTLAVIYQERLGEGKPWYLRYADFDLNKLETFVRQALATKSESPVIAQPLNLPDPEVFHFNYYQA